MFSTDQFFIFMEKREQIRLRKEAGLPKPWIDDDILQSYRFTNVRRENDKTSRELNDFYQQNLNEHAYHNWPVTFNSILLNCAIGRYFGRSEFLLSLGWQTNFFPQLIINHARTRRQAKLPVFTGAYVITNQGISAPKEEVVVDYFLKDLWDNCDRLSEIQATTNSWKAFIEGMQTIQGFGGSGFMAKEVLLDYIMATGWEPEDWNTWSPAGPGARRGAARVMGHDDPMVGGGRNYFNSAELTLTVMKELYELSKEVWPASFIPLRLTDIQFQLCEFDKYERVRLGQGRPRNRYDGYGEN